MQMFERYNEGLQVEIYLRDFDNLSPEEKVTEYLTDYFRPLTTVIRGEKNIEGNEKNVRFITSFLKNPETAKTLNSLYMESIGVKNREMISLPLVSNVEVDVVNGIVQHVRFYLKHDPIVSVSGLKKKSFNKIAEFENHLLNELNTIGALEDVKKSLNSTYKLTIDSAKKLDVFVETTVKLDDRLNMEQLKEIKEKFGSLRKRLMIRDIHGNGPQTEIIAFKKYQINSTGE